MLALHTCVQTIPSCQLFCLLSEILPLIENDSLIIEFTKGRVLRTGSNKDQRAVDFNINTTKLCFLERSLKEL